MKKSPKSAAPAQAEQNHEQELARIVPIRSETALTRYPVHRLAKKGAIKIEQTETNANGELVTVWEVKHPAGPLAYKIDTLIVNQRIDEMRNRGALKPLIKLGSLCEICLELGINASGKNTNAVREAIHENASAYIRAKLNYAGVDGEQQKFEFGTSRYAVIVKGDKLPDGKTADSVYLLLHELFLALLQKAKTRPLDYQYLTGLPPAAQRLYELLSFAMFGTLKHGRPNAQMLYSEFCQAAPLTRHYESKKMRAQMWKIHQPHIANEYFEKAEFVETVDAEGQIDWLMKYKPGRRARIEFATFTTKQKHDRESALRLAPAPKAPPAPPAPPLNEEETALVAQLTAYGITPARARKLVAQHRPAVERELQAFPQRDRSSIKEPAAWLIRAIESGAYSAPAKSAACAPQQPATPQQEQQAAQARAAAQRAQAARDRQNAFELAAQARYEQLPQAELQQRQAQAEADYAKVANFRNEDIWDIVLKSLVIQQMAEELAAAG